MEKSIWLVMMMMMALLHGSGATAESQERSEEKIALQGTVSSDVEGKMEGVLVSAKKLGGTITVTVASDS